MFDPANPLYRGACLVRPGGALSGAIDVPGDKSISHRAVMMAALAQGESRILGFLESEDCIATLNAFRAMGIESETRGREMTVRGKGLRGPREPGTVLDMGNSGTGSRLLMGILAGLDFSATLTGDGSLRSRPMGRVTEPLSRMGAQFLGREDNQKLPMTVRGGRLRAIEYPTPVPSAQIKSAVLLAGLFAEGTTAVIETGPSRDHTERMMKTLGVNIETEAGRHAIEGGQELRGGEIWVPGDISSAAFFIVAAAIIPGSDLVIRNVGVNPTRTGLIDALWRMGADIALVNERPYGAEPVADIHVRHKPLKGVFISGDMVVRMIDEFPVFAVAAAFAETPSIVEGAEELRVKESDRIAAIAGELGKMGVEIEERPDGFTVAGGRPPRGAACFSHGDHRIAMSLAVAGLAARGETSIRGTAPVNTSFPGFFQHLRELCPESLTEGEP